MRSILRDPTPRNPVEVHFHGQDVEVSRELRYLVADEAAAQTLGRRPYGRVVPFEDDWMQVLGLTLDLFDGVNRGVEAYRWLVTANPEASNGPPIRLLEEDRSEELLSLTRRHLDLDSGAVGTKQPA